MKPYKLLKSHLLGIFIACLGISYGVDAGAKEVKAVIINVPQRLLSVPIKPKPEFDVADHERRRALFKQMCAYPTPSQRVTFQIWAQGMKKTLGSDFCNDLEYKYFGTVREPRTGDSTLA